MNNNTGNEEKNDNGQNPKTNVQQSKPAFYVGIGASAGGLEALEKFFMNMPPDSNLTFVIVQHLSPDYKSLMVELLSRQTKMKVFRATENSVLRPNCMYIIPPKKNMTISEGRLHLTEQRQNKGLNLPIDIFLRSLAYDQKNNAIAIILSGTGSDGTLGIKAIKETGGMVMVQDEMSAKFDGMPRSVIATGLMDYILPPEQMPDELIKYIKHPYVKKHKNNSDELDFIGKDFLTKVLTIVRSHIGVDFTFYKPNTLIRRLERRISINQIRDTDEYIRLLQQSPNEVKVLYKEILIGVTQFFRDSEAFDLLNALVLPKIFKQHKNDHTIRIWSAACSTGEEAYSLAILMLEYMEEHDLDYQVKVFASDLDKDALDYAGAGLYPESIASDVSEKRLKKYFAKIPDAGYRINEKVRRMVVFARHNLLKDPPFSKMDLVVCRNLLIYLKSEMQNKVLSMFHFSLKNQGYLFLGSSENLGNLSDAFKAVNSKWKLYHYKSGGHMLSVNDLITPAFQQKKGSPDSNQSLISKEALPEKVTDQLLLQFVPPSILVDEYNNVVHFFRNVDRYIQFSYGKATFNILRLIRPEFSMILGGVLHKVRKERKDVVYRDIQFKNDDGEVISINLSAKLLVNTKQKEEFVLVTFEENLDKKYEKKIELDDTTMNTQYSERIVDLERQLQSRDENLQTTVEELETSNEELQATNEELIASNEELQSTNEELQSVNEELYTVNSEFQNKIQELTALNNDINNLLNTTKIGTLYLDRQLAIRKYTSYITAIFNIKDIDIGRPIEDFAFNANYNHFFDDVKEVLTKLTPKEIEVKDRNQRWHLLRIFPYFTQDDSVSGVIITLIDISERISIENRLRESREQYRTLAANLPKTDIYLFDNEMRFIIAQGSEMKRLNFSPDDFQGQKLTDILDKKTVDKLLPAYQKAISGQKAQIEFEYNDGYYRLKTIPLKNNDGHVYAGIAVSENITEYKTMENRLENEHQLLQRVLKNSPIGKIMVDKTGEITLANAAAKRILHLKETDIEGQKYDKLNFALYNEQKQEVKTEDWPLSKLINSHSASINMNYYIKQNHDWKPVEINAEAIFSENNSNITGAIFSISQ